MKLTILGSNSATQIYNRHPSSQLLTVHDQLYLIDCGEGTVFRLNEMHIKKNKINAIFISHLHGDHFYGLIGLLTTMSMQERSEPLTIVSPADLKHIITLQCEVSKSVIRFPIHYIEFEDKESISIFEDTNISVFTIPLVHKVTTCGFLFSKKEKPYTILSEKIAEYDLNGEEIRTLIATHSISKEGNTIKLSDISIANTTHKTFAYCSDTRYSETYAPYLQDVDTLYHEATFLEKEIERAIQTKHSTAKEAAIMAKLCNAKKLIIGHYSSRYYDITPLLEEAKTIFPNTVLAIEKETYTL